VTDEVARWEKLPVTKTDEFIDSTGLLNEFALMFDLKTSFPLHYFVFRQTASHVPHEGGVENIFSRSGNLADPNLDPHVLGTLTKIGINASVYKPPADVIWERYFKKFSKNGTSSPRRRTARMAWTPTHQLPLPPPLPSSLPLPLPLQARLEASVPLQTRLWRPRCTHEGPQRPRCTHEETRCPASSPETLSR